MRGPPKRKPKSGHQRTGLIFPIPRVQKLLKRDRINRMVSKGSAIVLTAVLEYLTSEIMELSAQVAKNAGKKRIAARHIQLALCEDDELSKLVSGMIISQGGVKPNIHPTLLKKSGKKGQDQEEAGGPTQTI